MPLTSVEDKYVIRWDLDPKSYFSRMTPIGPAFGASRNTTPRFDSPRAAQAMIDNFGLVVQAGSVVEAIQVSKP